MKSAKNTMLAQNMLAMSGSQGDLPWAFASLQTPYEGRLPADQDEPERWVGHAPRFYAVDFL